MGHRQQPQPWEAVVSQYTPSGSSGVDVTPGRPKVLARLSASQRRVLETLREHKMDPDKPVDQNLLGALSAIATGTYASDDMELVRTALVKQEMTSLRRGAYDDGQGQLVREQAEREQRQEDS
jgi:hypothetical protein